MQHNHVGVTEGVVPKKGWAEAWSANERPQHPRHLNRDENVEDEPSRLGESVPRVGLDKRPVVPGEGPLAADGCDRELKPVHQRGELIIVRRHVDDRCYWRKRGETEREGRLGGQKSAERRCKILSQSEEGVDDIKTREANHGGDPEEQGNLDARVGGLQGSAGVGSHHEPVHETAGADHHEELTPGDVRSTDAVAPFATQECIDGLQQDEMLGVHGAVN